MPCGWRSITMKYNWFLKLLENYIYVINMLLRVFIVSERRYHRRVELVTVFLTVAPCSGFIVHSRLAWPWVWWFLGITGCSCASRHGLVEFADWRFDLHFVFTLVHVLEKIQKIYKTLVTYICLYNSNYHWTIFGYFGSFPDVTYIIHYYIKIHLNGITVGYICGFVSADPHILNTGLSHHSTKVIGIS